MPVHESQYYFFPADAHTRGVMFSTLGDVKVAPKISMEHGLC